MRDITEEERRHYHHHGVVHLPGLLDDDWIGRLEAAFAEEMAADQAGLNLVDFRALTPMIEASGAEFITPEIESATGRFCISSFNWHRFPALAALFCGPRTRCRRRRPGDQLRPAGLAATVHASGGTYRPHGA